MHAALRLIRKSIPKWRVDLLPIAPGIILQDNVKLQLYGTSLRIWLAHAGFGLRGQDWYLLTAAGFISMAVPRFVFFALQRYFVRGMMAGSVKRLRVEGAFTCGGGRAAHLS